MYTTGEAPKCLNLCALFLVTFDLKVGYVKRWERATDTELKLEGVEFKCLPSGLHEVEQDVIYFQHEGHVGVSVFLRQHAPAAERNTKMNSIGLLVPFGSRKLGRCWQFVKCLQKLLRSIADLSIQEDDQIDQTMTQFFEKYQRNCGGAQALKNSSMSSQYAHAVTEQYTVQNPMDNGQSQERSETIGGNTISKDLALSEDHPARCLDSLVKVLGPFIFPIYRALLIGQRVLIFTEIPIRRACEYVYALSLISTIPSPIIEEFTSALNGTFRPPQVDVLFSIGVHDIPKLQGINQRRKLDSTKQSGTASWIACTTDSILQSKTELYDIAIVLPNNKLSGHEYRTHLKIQTSAGMVIKATPQDAIHYELLVLHCFSHETQPRNGVSSQTMLMNTYHSGFFSAGAFNELLYNGLLWWASAGERVIRRRTHLGHCQLNIESETEVANSNHCTGTLETDIIAYFRRKTIKLLSGIDEISRQSSSSTSPDNPDGTEEQEQLLLPHRPRMRKVKFGRHEFERIGLDINTDQDRTFLSEVAPLLCQIKPEVKRFAYCCSFCS